MFFAIVFCFSQFSAACTPKEGSDLLEQAFEDLLIIPVLKNTPQLRPSLNITEFPPAFNLPASTTSISSITVNTFPKTPKKVNRLFRKRAREST